MNKQEFNIAFGKSFSKIRKAKGLSQEDLAKELLLSRTSITNFEKGRQQLGLYHLWNASQILKVDVQSFFNELLTNHSNIKTFGQPVSNSTLKFLDDFLESET